MVGCSGNFWYGSLIPSTRIWSARIATGAMKPGGMITRKIKLNEVAEKGFVALIEDKDNQVKILVDIGAGI